jgi:N-acyl-D-amino-acid deacylase
VSATVERTLLRQTAVVGVKFERVRVVDGTGAPGFVGDVHVEGDRIIFVEPRDGPDSGLVLAPGFIDTHTHDDFAAVIHPEMGFKVQGGVTTCVVGNCGLGAAPFPVAWSMGAAFHPGQDVEGWDGYTGYFDRLDGEPASVNIAALVGHGTVRGAVMGLDERVPDDAQLDAMRALVAEGMDAGCVGMSTGLIYPPGRGATTDELVELATVVAGAGGIYTSHIRDEGERLLEAVDEAIEIGVRADLPVVISHLKAAGAENWGKVGDALARIDDAGPRVAADQYPYTAGSTVLSAVTDAQRLGSVVHPDDVVIASTDHHPEWNGRRLTDIAREIGVDADVAAEAVLEVEPTATVIMHSMSEDDVRTVLAHAGIMIGSDGLPTLSGHPHPRLYGTFARVLGHYVREVGLLPLVEAVHRMTGRPAHVFGFADRGVIRPGAFADLVLFDPASIIDLATFDDPQQPSAGIHGVWVNGTQVVVDGVHTGARPGRPLRRSA